MQMDKKAVQSFFQDFSIEITPCHVEKLSPLTQYLPAQTRVYVTFLSGASFEETIKAAEKVKAQGFTTVPHIVVRNLRSAQELEEGLARLNEAGIEDLLLLAGGGSDKRGAPYPDTLTLLDSGLIEQFHWKSIDFAGHPEGHPVVSDKDIKDALRVKKAYAKTYPRDYGLVTQFCFTAEPLLEWWAWVLSQEMHFSLRIGLAGVTSTTALINYARACGVGASLNFLIENSSTIRQLMKRSSEPNKLVVNLAHAFLSGEKGDNVHLHFFPLGNFVRTIEWIKDIQDGYFTLHTEEGIQIEK